MPSILHFLDFRNSTGASHFNPKKTKRLQSKRRQSQRKYRAEQSAQRALTASLTMLLTNRACANTPVLVLGLLVKCAVLDDAFLLKLLTAAASCNVDCILG